MIRGLPAATTLHGRPMHQVSTLKTFIAGDMTVGGGINRRTKQVNEAIEQATQAADDVRAIFTRSVDALNAAQNSVESGSKRVSTSLRKTGDELGQSMQRLEKAVNFERLERYVGLLERAAASLSTLADLERDGRLSHVIDALKDRP